MLKSWCRSDFGPGHGVIRCRVIADVTGVSIVSTVTAIMMTAMTLRVMHELQQRHVGFIPALSSKGTERVIEAFSPMLNSPVASYPQGPGSQGSASQRPGGRGPGGLGPEA